MAGLYAFGVAFTVWMGVDAARRKLYLWLGLILVSGPIGALAYYWREYGLDALPRFFLLLVQARLTKQDLRQAASEVERLDNASAWTEYAALLRARQRLSSALSAAREAVARDPESLEARCELGLCLLAARRFPEAVTELEAVTREDEGFDAGKALLALARARELNGDLAAARSTLETLAVRHPRPAILWELARVQAVSGDREAAVITLRRLTDDAESVPSYLRPRFEPWAERARKKIRGLSR
ncbi:MAG TPA: tetratricopeptide repeat protein [Thermoanaerobaculia bacterium]